MTLLYCEYLFLKRLTIFKVRKTTINILYLAKLELREEKFINHFRPDNYSGESFPISFLEKKWGVSYMTSSGHKNIGNERLAA